MAPQISELAKELEGRYFCTRRTVFSAHGAVRVYEKLELITPGHEQFMPDDHIAQVGQEHPKEADFLEAQQDLRDRWNRS